ncbi:hypothetical protein NC653_027207 [Populus alba x Populus x berolinensis]|uniref:Uncharacterized protein n=1 Tax=Populus alba x Populus x berolinensis TaxID=444605 RepID=A0AAD6M5N2_9ROSI|nr:hypothetical protein NC653_027207 [Populus alba x Populus x berolinensis]
MPLTTLLFSFQDFDRAKMAMHSGDGSWFVSDPLQRLLHPLLCIGNLANSLFRISGR